MKKMLFPLFLASAAFASTASAADVGIGVSFSDQQTIYVPIELNNNMRLEPFFSRSDDEVSTHVGTTTITNESSSMLIGAGFFGKMKGGSPNLQMYFGGRLGLIQIDETSTTCGTTTCTSVSSDGSGFVIAPTAGMEYAFDKKFVVGGEVSVFYNDVEDTTSSGTSTQIVLRYFF